MSNHFCGFVLFGRLSDQFLTPQSGVEPSFCCATLSSLTLRTTWCGDICFKFFSFPIRNPEPFLLVACTYVPICTCCCIRRSARAHPNNVTAFLFLLLPAVGCCYADGVGNGLHLCSRRPVILAGAVERHSITLAPLQEVTTDAYRGAPVLATQSSCPPSVIP